MTINEELGKLRGEASDLRKKFAGTQNAWFRQKEKNAKLETQIDTLKKEKEQLGKDNNQLKKEVDKLQDAITALAQVKDKYQGMIFKSSVKHTSNSSDTAKTGKKQGGQAGHHGKSRKKPNHIDQEKNVYFTCCPNCNNPVNQTQTKYQRIVIDIPITQTITTQYNIQRQWCNNCKKEISAVPLGTLPGLRFGENILSWLLVCKYRMRLPLNKIVEMASAQYQLTISEGGIQNILLTLKKQLGDQYQKIIQEIRKSKVKHADETSWRIDGQNSWCWLFATQKSAYYTIEETRGSGVPKKALEGSPPDSVLVRDDYGGYNCINANHQSCWSHLLRVSHESAVLPDASKEMTDLHKELTTMFLELQDIVSSPFQQEKRRTLYDDYTKKLEAIEQRKYVGKDALKVQTRIRNQHTNLITALLFPDVPLTNNHAERQIRPMAVTRKISGGSRSDQGAAVHSVLMSIVQTMSLRGQQIMQTLPKLLLSPAQKYTVSLEKGE